MKKTKVIVILGPTASGKTGVAIDLARRFGGEIVSADSLQLYRGADIGTAKATPGEWGEGGVAPVPHHMIDVADAWEEYTAGRYKKDARAAIAGIAERGKVPFIVGGTGLYIKALTKGLFEGPGENPSIRADLMATANEEGAERLHHMLGVLDKEAADAIHPNNLRRVVRALEVCISSGRPVSELQRDHGFVDEPYDCLTIGLRVERDLLAAAISERVDAMVAGGLLGEVRTLIEVAEKRGSAPRDLKVMEGLGYKEMYGHLRGETTLEEATGEIKKNTRRYAKRQMTWFRKVGGVRWFQPADVGAMADAVKAHLAGTGK